MLSAVFHTRLVPVILALVVGVPAEAARGLAYAPLPAATRARLDALRAVHHVPGAAIAVVDARAGRLAEAYLGRRDDRGAPVDAATVFAAASLSKPLFAQLAVTLAPSLGGLDAPLAARLHAPYLHDRAPWNEETQVDPVAPATLGAISARMLLQHTSGLPNWARAEPLAPATEPGRAWSYSSEGYVLLQRLLEQAAGAPLQTLAARRLFAPLGMTASRWSRPTDAPLATGHDRQGHPVATEAWPRAVASSSLFTTARDYGAFVAALLAPTAPLPLATLLERLVPVDAALGLSWGLGWAVEQLDGRRYAFHWGANPGFQSFVIASPADATAIVIFTNGDGGLDFAADAVALLWHREHPLFSFRMLHPN